ncbi:MAG: alpha/beta fold hydrolase, partial [Proteobacteria bacterium]|nr:alpha/beta fold hydrolase [Pseudomonadota bacterium]
MARVRANGIDIEFESHGRPQDPAVLLVMGLGRQLTAWPADLLAGLAGAGYRVIAYDNRDAGRSTVLEAAGRPRLAAAVLRHLLGLPVRAPYSLADLAADAAGLLDALEVPRAHVVGVSMGGMIGQVLAATRAERVASLTSIMSTSGARGLPGPRPAARRAMMSRPPRGA